MAEPQSSGLGLIEHALTTAAIGPYQIQAAIAAVHSEAPSAEQTDWPQILALYTLLERVAPNPVFALHRVVAVAMANGPEAGLAALAVIENDERLIRHPLKPCARTCSSLLATGQAQPPHIAPQRG